MRIIVRVLVGIVSIPLAVVLVIPVFFIYLLYHAGDVVLEEIR